ncbi:MAG: hypothetical protein JXR75_10580 [Rhodobacteraceae bacterium]|nr:hypothetical protein [Paracoccaceae bacterium]
MPLPLAPLLPIALRLGAFAAVGYAARRALARRSHIGRTDQRAEDALDDLDEGLATHTPRDATGQRNAALRIRRTIRFRGTTYELDTGAIARFRLRKLE